LTSTNSGGTPPYTYQWYINDQPVQGDTTSILEFVESTPGLYHISLGITDASGNYTLATFMGTFFIKVMALPTSSAPQNLTPTPTLTPTTTLTPSPNIPEFQSLTIPVLLSIIGVPTGLVVYFKKHKQ
jgi:hypothetical protein